MKKKIIAVFSCICIITSLMQMTIATAESENARYIMGATDDYYKRDDILYVNNTTGSFIKR